MGSADVVPGVSGGTMAVAMGIYQRLLAAIASINIRSLTALLRFQLRDALAQIHVRFLAALLVGVGLGVLMMVKVVRLPELLESSPKPVYAVFFGLVAASAVLVGKTLPRWSPMQMGALVAGVVGGFLVVSQVPVQTPTAPWFIFFAGFVAICAMVLPGISGSFVLLILGKYAYILNALGNLDIGVILPFGLGAVVGIATFSRLVAWALSRYHDNVLAVLVGLLVGSLWRIWPYQHLTVEVIREKPRVVAAEPYLPSSLEPDILVLALVGFALVLGLEAFARMRAQVRT